MRKQLPSNFSELKVGFLVLAGLIIAITTIFYISGSAVLGHTFDARTLLPTVSGLKKGAPVWIAGVEVGSVKAVNFIEPKVSRENQLLLGELEVLEDKVNRLDLGDPKAKEELNRITHSQRQIRARLRNVEVITKINARYKSRIRKDSRASLGSVGVLGDKYVEITVGNSPEPPMITNGMVDVPGAKAADISEIISDASQSVSEASVFMGQAREIASKVNSGEGTLGRLVNDSTMYTYLNNTLKGSSKVIDKVDKGEGTLGKLVSSPDLHDQASNLLKDMRQGKGSLGKLVKDPALYNNANKAVASMESMADKVNANKGTFGRLINDPSLFDESRDAMKHLKEIASRMTEGKGSLGKLSTDEELYKNTVVAMESISKLADDLEKGEGTLGRLFKNKDLYDNTNKLLTEIRDFMTEFKKNPKKYLTVTLKVKWLPFF